MGAHAQERQANKPGIFKRLFSGKGASPDDEEQPLATAEELETVRQGIDARQAALDSDEGLPDTVEASEHAYEAPASPEEPEATESPAPPPVAGEEPAPAPTDQPKPGGAELSAEEVLELGRNISALLEQLGANDAEPHESREDLQSLPSPAHIGSQAERATARMTSLENQVRQLTKALDIYREANEINASIADQLTARIIRAEDSGNDLLPVKELALGENLTRRLRNAGIHKVAHLKRQSARRLIDNEVITPTEAATVGKILDRMGVPHLLVTGARGHKVTAPTNLAYADVVDQDAMSPFFARSHEMAPPQVARAAAGGAAVLESVVRGKLRLIREE